MKFRLCATKRKGRYLAFLLCMRISQSCCTHSIPCSDRYILQKPYLPFSGKLPRIIQTEGRLDIGICFIRGDEYCLGDILGNHCNLMVPGKSIQKLKNLISRSGVYQLINVWQRVVVLQVVFVQININDTHPPRVIRFLDNDHIG